MVIDMDERYQTSWVSCEWTALRQYQLWLTVGRQVVAAQGKTGVIPRQAAESILTGVTPDSLTSRDVTAIRKVEQTTGHDVAAFLQWWERQHPKPAGRYVGYGLTSSDLVDTALGLRFKATLPEVESQLAELRTLLVERAKRYATTALVGRTHGQVAELTTLGLRFNQWAEAVRRTSQRLDDAWQQMCFCKLSGPVGTYSHNPPEVEREVARALGLWAVGDQSTQIAPRDLLAAWATAAAQVVAVCSKIGLDFRLMASRGEVSENWPEGRVGSSAMPHKRNPVRAERLAGLARLAHGYAQMLQPLDLWEDRDISHSSVERVAIPDLMHVVTFAVGETRDLLERAWWDPGRMADLRVEAGRLLSTATVALIRVDEGLSRGAARKAAQTWAGDYNLAPFGLAPAGIDSIHHPLVDRHRD